MERQNLKIEEVIRMNEALVSKEKEEKENCKKNNKEKTFDLTTIEKDEFIPQKEPATPTKKTTKMEISAKVFHKKNKFYIEEKKLEEGKSEDELEDDEKEISLVEDEEDEKDSGEWKYQK